MVAKGNDGLKRIAFTGEGVAADQAFEAYRKLWGCGSDVGRLGGRFVAKANLIQYPRMMLTDRRLAGLSHERDHGRVARDGFDHLNVQYVASGRLMVSTFDTVKAVEAGQIVVLDMTRPQRTWTEGARVLGASLPRELLPRPLPVHLPLHGLVLTKPCQPLGNVLGMLTRAAPAENAASAESATATVASMVGAALYSAANAGSPVSEGTASGLTGEGLIVEHARRDRAIAVIDGMLHRPELSPEAIAVAAGLSRASLYRLFEPFGGVVRYIQQRRLAAMRRRLGRPGENCSFATIALDHGFVSPSHASRCFKEQFGMTPGELRSRPRGSSASNAGNDGHKTLARWISDLM